MTSEIARGLRRARKGGRLFFCFCQRLLVEVMRADCFVGSRSESLLYIIIRSWRKCVDQSFSDFWEGVVRHRAKMEHGTCRCLSFVHNILLCSNLGFLGMLLAFSNSASKLHPYEMVVYIYLKSQYAGKMLTFPDELITTQIVPEKT